MELLRDFSWEKNIQVGGGYCGSERHKASSNPQFLRGMEMDPVQVYRPMVRAQIEAKIAAAGLLGTTPVWKVLENVPEAHKDPPCLLRAGWDQVFHQWGLPQPTSSL